MSSESAMKMDKTPTSSDRKKPTLPAKLIDVSKKNRTGEAVFLAFIEYIEKCGGYKHTIGHGNKMTFINKSRAYLFNEHDGQFSNMKMPKEATFRLKINDAINVVESQLTLHDCEQYPARLAKIITRYGDLKNSAEGTRSTSLNISNNNYRIQDRIIYDNQSPASDGDDNDQVASLCSMRAENVNNGENESIVEMSSSTKRDFVFATDDTPSDSEDEIDVEVNVPSAGLKRDMESNSESPTKKKKIDAQDTSNKSSLSSIIAHSVEKLANSNCESAAEMEQKLDIEERKLIMQEKMLNHRTSIAERRHNRKMKEFGLKMAFIIAKEKSRMNLKIIESLQSCKQSALNALTTLASNPNVDHSIVEVLKNNLMKARTAYENEMKKQETEDPFGAVLSLLNDTPPQKPQSVEKMKELDLKMAFFLAKQKTRMNLYIIESLQSCLQSALNALATMASNPNVDHRFVEVMKNHFMKVKTAYENKMKRQETEDTFGAVLSSLNDTPPQKPQSIEVTSTSHDDSKKYHITLNL